MRTVVLEQPLEGGGGGRDVVTVSRLARSAGKGVSTHLACKDPAVELEAQLRPAGAQRRRDQHARSQSRSPRAEHARVDVSLDQAEVVEQAGEVERLCVERDRVREVRLVQRRRWRQSRAWRASGLARAVGGEQEGDARTDRRGRPDASAEWGEARSTGARGSGWKRTSALARVPPSRTHVPHLLAELVAQRGPGLLDELRGWQRQVADGQCRVYGVVARPGQLVRVARERLRAGAGGTRACSGQDWTGQRAAAEWTARRRTWKPLG